MPHIRNLAPVGLGAMSLCIDDDRPSEQDAIAMMESLIADHGLTFIDTANAYCLDSTEFGYGDRLVRSFMNRDDVMVATKIGMTREGRTWRRRGDPAFLRSSCEESLRNLGVESIELCQFHGPDKDVP